MNFSNMIGNISLFTRRHSPEILLGTGLGCFGAGIAFSIIGAPKFTKAYEKKKEEAAVVKKTYEYSLENDTVKYSETDMKRDLKVLRRQTIVEAIKDYWPVALCVVAGTVSILASHNILNGRRASAIAALAATDSAFEAYRSRVREKLGEEAEHDIFVNKRQEEIEEDVVDEETGEVKKVKKTVEKEDPVIYGEMFDEINSEYWSDTYGRNRDFLHSSQDYFNQKLNSCGHVWLDEIYEHLGMRKNPKLHNFGWLKRKNVPEDENVCIDFNVFNNSSSQARAFAMAEENNVWISFNGVRDIVNDLPVSYI